MVTKSSPALSQSKPVDNAMNMGSIMKKKIYTAVFAFAVASLAPAAIAHEGGQHDDAQAAYGEPGTASSPSREVVVLMKEGEDTMSFAPARIEVKQGEQIRFIVQNDGELDHEFFFGTEQEMIDHADMMRAMPDMKHADANSLSVSPKSKGSLLWRFTSTGEFPFACLIPGHSEAGMKGVVAVK